VAGAWRWPSTPSSAEVKERVELYLYSPSGYLWPALGWTLHLRYVVFAHAISFVYWRVKYEHGSIFRNTLWHVYWSVSLVRRRSDFFVLQMLDTDRHWSDDVCASPNARCSPL